MNFGVLGFKTSSFDFLWIPDQDNFLRLQIPVLNKEKQRLLKTMISYDDFYRISEKSVQSGAEYYESHWGLL